MNAPSQTEAGRAARREAQLLRILESKTFRNTEVLKRLLDYLGRKTLAGDTEDLKEYTVGTEAFAKPAGYDPKVDSSVRVQAGKLRQKLDEYYRVEGLDDSLIVELPKGHFTLSFREYEAPVKEPAPNPPPRRPRNLLPWVVAALSVAAAIVIAFERRDNPALERYRNPEIRALWQPFLADARPAIMSLGTPLFAKISGSFFRDPVMNSWDQASASSPVDALQKNLNGKAVPAYPYTGIGEAWAAFELARLFLAGGKDLNLVLSNALTWSDIESHNVIFIGPPKYNLQMRDLPIQQDFAVEHSRVINQHPKPGEPPSYDETWSSDHVTLAEGHALISRLPGLHGAGYIMTIASTSTEGTRAAVEFVTRPDYAARLVRSLRGNGGAIPRYFQAVVRARFKSQTPIQVELVTVHALGR